MHENIRSLCIIIRALGALLQTFSIPIECARSSNVTMILYFRTGLLDNTRVQGKHWRVRARVCIVRAEMCVARQKGFANTRHSNSFRDVRTICRFPPRSAWLKWSPGVNDEIHAYIGIRAEIAWEKGREKEREKERHALPSVRILVTAPPSLPSDKLSLKHPSSFPLRKTRNNTSTFNESRALPRHPNLLNAPIPPGMNAVVRRSSIGVLVLLFSELSKVRRARYAQHTGNTRHTRSRCLLP